MKDRAPSFSPSPLISSIRAANRASLAALMSALMLTACGGGGDQVSGVGVDSTPAEEQQSDQQAQANGTVNMFMMDDLTLDYSKVWVTIERVTVEDTSGTLHSLFAPTSGSGEVVNLTELDNIGELLAIHSLPVGNYSNIRVTLGREVQLEDQAGTLTQATFDSTGDFVLLVDGSFDILSGLDLSIALDFDLSQFTYDASTNLVTPVVILRQQSELASLDQSFVERSGSVVAIDASGFDFRPDDSSENLRVELSGIATITDEATGTVYSTLDALAVGQQLDLFGDYDLTTATLTAISIHIEAEPGQAGIDPLVEVEGIVEAWDPDNRELLLDVRESDVLIPSATLTLQLDDNAHFIRGSEHLLAVGQRLELLGDWDGIHLNVDLIEIEGTPSNASDDDDEEDSEGFSYGEVEGTLVSVTDQTLILTVEEEEYTGVAVGTDLTVDFSNAWFKRGSEDDLVVGAQAEFKGELVTEGLEGQSESRFIATLVELQFGNDDDEDDEDEQDEDEDDE